MQKKRDQLMMEISLNSMKKLISSEYEIVKIVLIYYFWKELIKIFHNFYFANEKPLPCQKYNL